MFLRLPLELRFMIYDHAMDFATQLPLTYIQIDHDESRRALAQLCGVSSQIRYEMHSWLANAVYCNRLAVPNKSHDVLPCSSLVRCRTVWRKHLDEEEDFNLDALCSFKFWQVFFNIDMDFSGIMFVKIDFRKREVSVSGTKVRLSHLARPWYLVRKGKKLSPEALQTTEVSVTRSMQAVIEREGFDGFTLGDMDLLLSNLRVSHLERSGDWALLFDDGNTSSLGQDGFRKRIKYWNHRQS